MGSQDHKLSFCRLVISEQGILIPRIHNTMLKFFIEGGKVTTPTITGDLFSPRDIMNILVKLIMNYLELLCYSWANYTLSAYPSIQCLFRLCPLLILHTGPQNQFFLSTGTVSTQIRRNCLVPMRSTFGPYAMLLNKKHT